MMTKQRRLGKRNGGFTLIEMVLALTITVMVMAGVLNLFQMSAKIARNQTQLSDLQQNLRVALYDTQKFARMAGRGGLPVFLPETTTPAFAGHYIPNGVAVALGNNWGANSHIGDNTTPLILEGTDTLTVRGVLFGSVYQSNISTDDFALNRITVGRFSRMGVEQDLESLAQAVKSAVDDSQPEALIIVSPVSSTLYGIVEVTGGSVDPSGWTNAADIKSVTLNFVRTGGTHQGQYLLMMPGGEFPSEMTAGAYVGVLEEYRYYVRAVEANPGVTGTATLPRLSRARFYPNTNAVHPSNPSAAEDISDNVWDFQIAFGIDQNGDGEVTEGADDAGKVLDEWLFNITGDTATDTGEDPTAWTWNGRPLELMRLSVLVRTDRRDLKYASPKIFAIEDRAYNERTVVDLKNGTNDERSERQYRRRIVRSVVDFRNL